MIFENSLSKTFSEGNSATKTVFELSSIAPNWKNLRRYERTLRGETISDIEFSFNSEYFYDITYYDTLANMRTRKRTHRMTPRLVVSRKIDNGQASCYVYYDMYFRNKHKLRLYITLKGEIFAAVSSEINGRIERSASVYETGKEKFKNALSAMTGEIMIIKMKRTLQTKYGGEINSSTCIGHYNPITITIGGGDNNEGEEIPDPEPEVPTTPGIPIIEVNPIKTVKAENLNITGTEEQINRVRERLKEIKKSRMARKLLKALNGADAHIICTESNRKIQGIESYGWYNTNTKEIFFNTDYLFAAPLLEEIFHFYQKQQNPSAKMPDMEFEAKCFLAMAINESQSIIKAPTPNDAWKPFLEYIKIPSLENFNEAASTLILRFSPYYQGTVYREELLNNFYKLKNLK